MISQNQKPIGERKIKNKAGGDANESRFGYVPREKRKHKVIIVPSINAGKAVKVEQGWTRQAKNGDVVRITIGKETCIAERVYLEQALFAMAEGDEMLKYSTPTIKNL